jgi:tousled-like kinase
MEVACKMHHLNSSWSEHAKRQYVKHALRENEIHNSLKHPNIVKLYETFEIDSNTICTVLEFCEGPDLSQYMKQYKFLPEKDAKCILKQIIAGLRYLHENKKKIIHYDLKPQNIIFHRGEIKISDFGLCKIMEDNVTRVELTSQGVGTYWYLPPECFEIGESPPNISTKVDIWSLGVIFFEMLFGEKPFGQNMSQERILKEQVILHSDDVKFPNKPSISNECKEFISSCLIKDPEKRWDINGAINSFYLSKK